MNKLFLIGGFVAATMLFFNACLVQESKSAKLNQKDLSALKVSAEKGDAKAQLEYGKALKETSREEARIWIRKAADQGLAEAWFWLGYAGLGKEKEVFYYEKAAEGGYPEAYTYLLDHLLFRAGASADVDKAKKFADLARKRHIEIYDAAKKFETIDHCYEAGLPTIPVLDLPMPEEKNSFSSSKIDCSSYQFGLGASQDWNKYRKCLLSEPEVDNNAIAEIYANGWGVKRNAKLAIALVCHGGQVPAELEGMVDTLYHTKDQDHLQREFTFCDHVTSGMNSGFCASQAEAIASKKRDLEVAGLTQDWTEDQKAAFRALRKVAYAFFSEHAGSEQDMSGTARAQISIDEEAKLRNELLASLKSFDAGLLPKEDDFVKADKELNDLYSRIMKKEKIYDFGTITKEGIKATQRKWIKYRDAWVRFAVLRYRNTSPDLWRTWITRQRIGQLKEFVKPI